MSNQPIALAVIFRAAAGREADLEAALLGVVAPTRGEPGCLAYDLHRSIDEPGVFFFTERWADEAALAGHDASPHVAALRAALGPLVAGPATKVRGVAAGG